MVKFRSMQGYDAPFVPGWDTHGLPTEIAAIRAFRHRPPRDTAAGAAPALRGDRAEISSTAARAV